MKIKSTIFLFVAAIAANPAIALEENAFQDTIPQPVDLFDAIMFSIEIFKPIEVVRKTTIYAPLYFEETSRGTEVGIVATDRSIMVGFRGTELDESEDNVANIGGIWTGFGVSDIPGRVHKGLWTKVFRGGLHLRLKDAVEKALESYGPLGYDLIITGHSAGAVKATLFGAYLAKEMPSTEIKVYNFGSPRVGDNTFKNSLRKIENLAIWRMVYQEDIIARMPGSFLGYRHPGHLIIWDFDRSKAFFQQTGDQDLKYRGVTGSDWDMRFDPFDPLDPRHDHSTSEYLFAIDASESEPGYWPQDFERMERVRVCCAWFCVRRCWEYR